MQFCLLHSDAPGSCILLFPCSSYMAFLRPVPPAVPAAEKALHAPGVSNTSFLVLGICATSPSSSSCVVVSIVLLTSGLFKTQTTPVSP